MNKNPYLLQIGKKIKETRLSNGNRIKDIAQRANVSKGLISKIENGRTVPSLPVLISIIDALNSNVSDFFHDIEPIATADFIHIKKRDYNLMEKEKSEGFVYHHIHNQDFSGFSFAASLLEINPGATRKFVTTDGYEFLYVLDGCIDYNLGDKKLRLEKGDSLFFNGRIPHLPQNLKNEVAQLLVVYILS